MLLDNILYLLRRNVPAHWIEMMDEETMIGWIWASYISDGTHVWSDIAGKPVMKDRD